MKNMITALVTSFGLLFSSLSFASVSQSDADFLFSASNVELQEMNNTEMATTEGQLFGITMETTTKYLGLAFNALKPYASKAFNALKDKLIAAIKTRFEGFVGANGSITTGGRTISTADFVGF